MVGGFIRMARVQKGKKQGAIWFVGVLVLLEWKFMQC